MKTLLNNKNIVLLKSKEIEDLFNYITMFKIKNCKIIENNILIFSRFKGKDTFYPK